MKQLFRKEVYQHHAQRLNGTISLARPPAFVWLTALIATVLLLALVFLVLADYARKETARGMLEPAAGMIRVRPPGTGVVSQLLVSEGERVKQGQPLLYISDDNFVQQGGALHQSLAAEIDAQMTRLDAQIANQDARFALQQQELGVRLLHLNEQTQRLDAQLALFEQRLQLNRELLAQLNSLGNTGYASGLEIQRQQDSLLSLSQQHHELASRRLSLDEQRQGIENEQHQLPLTHQDHRHRLEAQRTEFRNKRLRLQHEDAAEVRAPVAGVISGILTHAGQPVNNAQPVLSILPVDSPLQAVLYLPTRSVGMISHGQRARLRFDAFPYERFGVHSGTVIEVGATVIFPDELSFSLQQPSYRVVVELDAQSVEAYGRAFALRPGMELEADLLTERRSLIRWLFDPIFSVQRKMQ